MSINRLWFVVLRGKYSIVPSSGVDLRWWDGSVVPGVWLLN